MIGVGEPARSYAPDEWAPDPEAAVEIADGLLGEGDRVLVKGSRAVGLERFTDEMRARRILRSASGPAGSAEGSGSADEASGR